MTGCDGAVVSNLTPSVQLEQNDTTADIAVNRTRSALQLPAGDGIRSYTTRVPDDADGAAQTSERRG